MQRNKSVEIDRQARWPVMKLCNFRKVIHFCRTQLLLGQPVQIDNAKSAYYSGIDKVNWLPVRWRVQYTFMIFVFSALKGLASGFILDHVILSSPNRDIQSDDSFYSYFGATV